MTTAAAAQIYAAMSAVMKDMQAVRKTGINKEQGYWFRSIEDVLAAAHTALVRNGVFFLPQVLTRIPEERETKRGGQVNVIHLEIKYTFYAADGSNVSAVVWGEGSDMADKSTNKAMSQALKYNLVQALCISAGDMADPDVSAEEAGPRRMQRSSGRVGDDPWQAPPADLAWAKEAAARAAGASQADAEELWKETKDRFEKRLITPDDSKRITTLLKARFRELRAATSAALEAEDSWSAKVEDIHDLEDAAAALADLNLTFKNGHITEDRFRKVEAAISAKCETIGAAAAA